MLEAVVAGVGVLWGLLDYYSENLDIDTAATELDVLVVRLMHASSYCCAPPDSTPRPFVSFSEQS